MKSFPLATCLFALSAGAFAQGALDFCNYKPGHAIAAPVFDSDGVTRLGDQFLGQLYVGGAAADLAPIGTPVAFRSHSGTNTGYLVAGAVVTPYAGGTTLLAELRAWPKNAGATYEAAVAAGAKTGKSAAITVTLNGPTSPPDVPPLLTGLHSFSLKTGATENRPPVSSGFGATTPQNQPLLIPFASLLQPIHDPDGDPVHVASVSGSSTNGALVVGNTTTVVYLPNQDFVGADRFSYVVSDSSGATNTVFSQIAVLPPGVVVNSIRSPVVRVGSVSFNFTGLPGKTYDVQRAGPLAGPWLAVGTFTVAPDGSAEFTDPSPLSGSGFYRTILLP